MIQIKDVSAKTQKGEVLLRHINFEISDTDFIFLHGKSGSGKSLLSKFIAGISMGDLNVMGSISFNGKELRAGYLEDNKLRLENYVNMIFQNQSRMLNRAFSVQFHLDESARYLKNPKSRVSWIVDYFGFDSNFLKKYPYMLSEGEKQRLVVAMCMMQKPHLLIADEIISAQDDENGNLVLDLIEKVHKEHQIPVLLISHQQLGAKRMVNRHLLIENGIVTEQVIKV